MKKSERKENLIPNGIPKWIRCYDNGGKTADRYTVIYTHAHSFGMQGRTVGVGMSADPYHPQGFGQHFDFSCGVDRPKCKHLGRKIKFQDLPGDCQKLVLNDYKEMWNIED